MVTSEELAKGISKMFREMEVDEVTVEKESKDKDTVITCEVERVHKQPLSDDYRRLYSLLHAIFRECKKYGYHLENRLELRDLKSGKIFK